MITLNDFFCGAGGSSTGAKWAGVSVQMAVNHSKIAIATHSTNHPDTEHDITDLTATPASRYRAADMMWISPECTNHSIAKGRKRKNIHQIDLWGNTQVDPDEERSRATMREVVEFTACHRYKVVIVENVIDVGRWQFYDDWLTAMVNLGYDYRTLYLNARFFGVPQSRDRWYTVFWRKGMSVPDLDFSPTADCPVHGTVKAVQSWKNGYPWGAYGKQYVYACPHCAREITPDHVPAAAIIDWSLPAPRIRERTKPLAASTMQRIRSGLKRYGRAASRDDQAGAALEFQPFISSQYKNADGSSTRTSPVTSVLPTVTTFNNQHQLVVPPFVTEYYGQLSMHRVTAPLSTITTRDRHGLVVPPEIGDDDIEAILPECGFRMLEPHELKLAMSFDDTYVVLGNKKQQTWQIGNAVCCLVAKALVQRCVDMLMSVA